LNVVIIHRGLRERERERERKNQELQQIRRSSLFITNY
jgi:hypothetical protein